MAELENTIYQLSDWKNAVKMQNELNPDIKIDILELQEDSGYVLTVFEDLSDHSNILYRVPVECTLQNNWSLSSQEAVVLLNTVGFPCIWVEPSDIPVEAHEQLQYLKDFGWSTIVRFIRPAEVHVVNATSDKSASLASIIPNFNYRDWEFLTVGIPTPIEGLLNENTSNEEQETED